MKVFVAACLSLFLITLTADADIIYFKDGMKTICQERAWEEDGQIKCEYAGWVLMYPKNEVSRILKTKPAKHAVSPKKKQPITQKIENDGVKKKISIQKTNIIAFYDPRRPYKYWTGSNSKHKSYKEAIQTLAKKYERSPEWVQANMGDTNDLEQIHRNLKDPNLSSDTILLRPPAESPPGITFYNPRRPLPYWTGKTSKHKSYNEAIQALAVKYEQSPDWIQKNMGTTNDLNEIHQNLRNTIESMDN